MVTRRGSKLNMDGCFETWNFDMTLGFTFTEKNSARASASKVVSCHISSDGKVLASGGLDKKVSE